MSGVPPLEAIEIGVIVARRKAQSQWTDFTWTPVAVLVGLPEALPWTALSQGRDETMFYAGSAEIRLYRSETGNYRDNLSRASRNFGSRCAQPGSIRPMNFSRSPRIPPKARH